MHCCPEATQQIVLSEQAKQYAIKAVGAPFDVKDSLSGRGYRWNPDKYGKVWRTVIKDANLPEEKAFLAALYHHGDTRSDIASLDSRTRFL